MHHGGCRQTQRVIQPNFDHFLKKKSIGSFQEVCAAKDNLPNVH